MHFDPQVVLQYLQLTNEISYPKIEIMKLDPYTLILISQLLTMGLGVCLLIIARKDYPGNIQKSMQRWIIAYIIQTVGWALLAGSKGIISDFLAIILGNAVYILSLAQIYHALRVFDAMPPRWWLSYGMTGLSLVIGSAGLALSDICPHFLLLESWLAAVLLILCGLHLMRAPLGKSSIVRQILVLLFFLLTLIYFLRCGSILSSGQSGTSISSNMPWLTLVFSGSVVSLLTSIGFLMLCNERLNQELKRLAITDELTGLYNRRKIEQLATLAIDEAQKSYQPLTFLLLDADNFKTINDTFGHLAGDHALQVIADILKGNLRASEMVGRFGGDEFVILLPNTPKVDGLMVAERLFHEVSKTKLPCHEGEIQLGISYGMAVLTSGKTNFSQLVRIAYQSLYAMKRNKRKADPNLITAC